MGSITISDPDKIVTIRNVTRSFGDNLPKPASFCR